MQTNCKYLVIHRLHAWTYKHPTLNHCSGIAITHNKPTSWHSNLWKWAIILIDVNRAKAIWNYLWPSTRMMQSIFVEPLACINQTNNGQGNVLIILTDLFHMRSNTFPGISYKNHESPIKIDLYRPFTSIESDKDSVFNKTFPHRNCCTYSSWIVPSRKWNW